MRSETSRLGGLKLEPGARIERPLSVPEYYHASFGNSPRTLERQRQVIIIVEGDGPDFEPERWQRALDLASMANAGTRMLMAGTRRKARWTGGAPMPVVRYIEHTDWTGISGEGSEFIDGEEFSLQRGPTVELILVNSSPRGRLVILRTSHAIMDAVGAAYFLQELFRAMRGEPLLGTNAAFSDTDLMRAVGARRTTSRHIRTEWLTGKPEGEEIGDEWRRGWLETSKRNVLDRVSAIMAEYMHLHSDRPALIAVAVDLRRHYPGLVSTANFAGLLLVKLEKGEGPEVFRSKLKAMVRERMDTFFPRLLDLVKLLPATWLDRLVSRTPTNYRRKRAVETALISYVGRIPPEAYSCEFFTMREFYGFPIHGGIFLGLCTVGDRIQYVFGMPKVLASNGRLDAFLEYLQRRLAETDGARGRAAGPGTPNTDP